VAAPKRVVHRNGYEDRKDKVYPLDKSAPFAARRAAAQKFTYNDLNSYWSNIDLQDIWRLAATKVTLEYFCTSCCVCDPLDSGHQECPSINQTPDHYTEKSAWSASREQLLYLARGMTKRNNMFILAEAMSDCATCKPLLTLLAADVKGEAPKNADPQAGYHRHEPLHRV